MSELPTEAAAFEKEEDIYEPVDHLGDYINELQKFLVTENGELIKVTSDAMKTVEQRYAERKKRHMNQIEDMRTRYQSFPDLMEKYMKPGEEREIKEEDRFEEIIRTHPKKIAALNYIAHLINGTTDAVVYMRAANVMNQLINGKNAKLIYLRPEADPRMLAV